MPLVRSVISIVRKVEGRCNQFIVVPSFLSFFSGEAHVGKLVRENRRVQERVCIPQIVWRGRIKEVSSAILGICWMLRREWSAANEINRRVILREQANSLVRGCHNSNER
jgi:hypothetical protein